MKVLHIGQMIGGLDIYVRNSITFASGNIEYVIVHGKNDKSKPVYSQGREVKEYLTTLQRNLNPLKDGQALWQALFSARLPRKSDGCIRRLSVWQGWTVSCWLVARVSNSWVLTR